MKSINIECFRFFFSTVIFLFTTKRTISCEIQSVVLRIYIKEKDDKGNRKKKKNLKKKTWRRIDFINGAIFSLNNGIDN